MGPPGSGKTSVGKAIAARLGMSFYDIDDHHLEPLWNASVAQKLNQWGEQRFLDEEGNALLKLDRKNSVISLSGSNPLHKRAMEHVMNHGFVVFLDIPSEDIVSRMQSMKVDRIVGQKSSSLADILAWRSRFYNSQYHARVLAEPGTSVDRLVDKVLEVYNKEEDFLSTRGTCDSVNPTFLDVVRKGIAPNRGLYIPKRLGDGFTMKQLERLVPLNFHDRALRILEAFPLGSMLPSKLSSFVDQAYSRFYSPHVIPVEKLFDDIYLMETFHGPTASFKDIALQIVPKFLHKASVDSNSISALLVATSGDTGSAALDGFSSQNDVAVIVLYPREGVSLVQERQMLSSQGDSCVIGVSGDFDFCQSTVKDMFEDSEFNHVIYSRFGAQLTAANSINWGRLFPQVMFAFNSYLEMVKKGHISIGDLVDFAIPTGNFGNIMAAYYAKLMGLPIGQLVSVSNANNVLFDFFRSGVYDLRQRTLNQTFSPSVDILISSNLERFIYEKSTGDSELVQRLFDSLSTNEKFQVDPDFLYSLQQDIKSTWCPESDCLKTIRTVYDKTRRLVDPHTALALDAAIKMRNRSRPIIVSSTAHFAKFPEAIFEALEIPVDTGNLAEMMKTLQSVPTVSNFHPGLDDIAARPIIHRNHCPSDSRAIKHKIIQFFEQRSKFA
jgi:threonine synthase